MIPRNCLVFFRVLPPGGELFNDSEFTEWTFSFDTPFDPSDMRIDFWQVTNGPFIEEYYEMKIRIWKIHALRDFIIFCFHEIASFAFRESMYEVIVNIDFQTLIRGHRYFQEAKWRVTSRHVTADSTSLSPVLLLIIWYHNPDTVI